MTLTELAGILDGIGCAVEEVDGVLKVSRTTKVVELSREVLKLSASEFLFVAKQVGDLL
ncbi:hypothetical protein [Lelliottia wanjuensis]|uniref:hypothetical protein n=1 Tax=Lelliottia wanjuensis TaxID=3050585 RepID=UPI0025510D27|nr:hypothetical protein [Lelliottia sp. V104_15]MDK9607091.1 hypothetical protein [Lelliottia sp. V104_15]